MNINPRHKPITWIVVIFLILALIAFTFLAISLTANKNSYRDLDFFTFWLGGRLASQGQDVYNSTQWVGAHSVYGSTWIPNLYYVYPLFTAILFIPLGLLPIEAAAFVWLLISFLSILVSLVILLKLWKPLSWQKWVIPFTLVLCLFRPIILIFLMGQVGGLLLLLIVLAIYLISTGKPVFAHGLLAFLLIKPNIGVPLLGAYCVWLLWRGKWKNLAVLASASLALLLVPLLIDPIWIRNYIQVGLYKSQIDNLYPTLRGLAGLVTENRVTATTLLWAASSLALVVGVIVVVKKLKKTITAAEMLCFSILICLLVTPYLRSYDFLLLLIPILYVILARVNPGSSITKPTLHLLGWGVFSLALLALATKLDHDIWSVVFPLAVLSAFIMTLFSTEKKRVQATLLTEAKGINKGDEKT